MTIGNARRAGMLISLIIGFGSYFMFHKISPKIQDPSFSEENSPALINKGFCREIRQWYRNKIDQRALLRAVLVVCCYNMAALGLGHYHRPMPNPKGTPTWGIEKSVYQEDEAWVKQRKEEIDRSEQNTEFNVPLLVATEKEWDKYFEALNKMDGAEIEKRLESDPDFRAPFIDMWEKSVDMGSKTVIEEMEGIEIFNFKPDEIARLIDMQKPGVEQKALEMLCYFEHFDFIPVKPGQIQPDIKTVVRVLDKLHCDQFLASRGQSRIKFVSPVAFLIPESQNEPKLEERNPNETPLARPNIQLSEEGPKTFTELRDTLTNFKKKPVKLLSSKSGPSESIPKRLLETMVEQNEAEEDRIIHQRTQENTMKVAKIKNN